MTSKSYTHTKAAAYHEAGHVIIDILCSVPFEKVSLLTPEEDVYCAGKVFKKEGTSVSIDTFVAVCLAGNIAEAKYRRRAIEGFNYCIEDIKNARDAAKTITYREVDRTMNEVGEWVRDSINKHWDDVVKVAEALMERNTLTYNEVLKLIEKSE